jgi:hypothetical protein
MSFWGFRDYLPVAQRRAGCHRGPQNPGAALVALALPSGDFKCRCRGADPRRLAEKQQLACQVDEVSAQVRD